jgi:hypothetical protein
MGEFFDRDADWIDTELMKLDAIKVKSRAIMEPPHRWTSEYTLEWLRKKLAAEIKASETNGQTKQRTAHHCLYYVALFLMQEVSVDAGDLLWELRKALQEISHGGEPRAILQKHGGEPSWVVDLHKNGM